MNLLNDGKGTHRVTLSSVVLARRMLCGAAAERCEIAGGFNGVVEEESMWLPRHEESRRCEEALKRIVSESHFRVHVRLCLSPEA